MESLKLILDFITGCQWSICVGVCICVLGIFSLIIFKEPISEFLKKLHRVNLEKSKDNCWKFSADDSKPAGVSPIQAGNETEEVFLSGQAESENKFQKDKLKTLLKENKFGEIEEECKKWKDKDKKNAYPYFFQGKAYIKQRRYEFAIKEYKEGMRINPDDAEAHLNLGVAYDNKGSHEEAREYYENSLKIAKAIGDKEVEGTCHYNFGVTYGKKGLYDKAIKEWKEAIKIKPDFVMGHYNLGWVYGEKGLYDEAIEKYKEAIRLNPDYALVHYNLGWVYEKKGLYDKAIKEFKEVLRLNPNDVEARYNLGVTYGEKGLHNEAIEEFKEALRINPDDVKAHCNLGVAYEKKGLHDQAIEEYKEALRIKPDYALAHCNLGWVYLTIGRRGDALDEYKILKKLDKELANKLFNLIYK